MSNNAGATIGENRPSEPVKTTHRMRSLTIHLVLLVLAFLLGFVPMWWSNSRCSGTLSGAERQLGLAKMENSLGSAAIDARRGDYEAARLAASDFFTLLGAETSKGVESALSKAQQDGAQPLLAQRDQVITVLARGDATSASVLMDLYLSFRKLASP